MGDSSLSFVPSIDKRDNHDTMPQVTGHSLSVQIIHGTAWNVVGTILKQVIAISATVIVTRLLTPADYAVGGLAVTIMGLFAVLTGQGFAQALVQREVVSELLCDSVFWPMVGGGIGLTALAILLAPLLAQFYRQPDLTPVICLLAVGLAFGMAGSVPSALLQRAMRFREINLIGIVGGALSAGLGMGLAIMGRGYWALVAPVAGAAVATALGAFWVTRYRPRRRFSSAEFASTVSFGLSLLGSNLLQYFNDFGDRLILGRFWRSDVLGYYYFALERSRQPFVLILAQISTVIFPAFSTIQADRHRLRKAVLVGTLRFCICVFPVYILLTGLAELLLPWLFGSQWQPAVEVFRIFAIYSFVRAFAALVPGTYLAIEQPQVNLVFNIFRAIVIFPVLVYLGAMKAGIVTMAIVLVVIWVIQAPFYVGYLFRQINIRLRDLWAAFRGLLLATFLMALVLIAVRSVGDRLGWPHWAIILSSATVSSGVFLFMLRGELVAMLRQVRRAYTAGR